MGNVTQMIYSLFRISRHDDGITYKKWTTIFHLPSARMRVQLFRSPTRGTSSDFMYSNMSTPPTVMRSNTWSGSPLFVGNSQSAMEMKNSVVNGMKDAANENNNSASNEMMKKKQVQLPATKNNKLPLQSKIFSRRPSMTRVIVSGAMPMKCGSGMNGGGEGACQQFSPYEGSSGRKPRPHSNNNESRSRRGSQTSGTPMKSVRRTSDVSSPRITSSLTYETPQSTQKR